MIVCIYAMCACVCMRVCVSACACVNTNRNYCSINETGYTTNLNFSLDSPACMVGARERCWDRASGSVSKRGSASEQVSVRPRE